MKRTWHIWILFSLCFAVVLAAMGWVTLMALQSDRAEAEAKRRAAVEESVRLALWRMDSLLAPLLAQESARPYFVYSSFLPADRTYGRMFNREGGDEMLVPSPLLGDISPYVVVYFQFHPDGHLTSPELPLGENRDRALAGLVSENDIREAELQLTRLDEIIDHDRLLAMLPESELRVVQTANQPGAQSDQQVNEQRLRQAEAQRRGPGAAEFNMRNQAVAQQANVMVQAQLFNPLNQWALETTDVGGVLMVPLWIDGQLVLARRIAVSGEEYVQGCLLDWPAIKQWLLEAVDDLFPKADLSPAEGAMPDNESRMLAALPVQFVPGNPTAAPVDTLSPIRLSLAIAWACFLTAALAVATLLGGVIRLSERRAAFVSAVTHELRTPLTTFHMYTEMLAEGMVPDEKQQHSYLVTLRTEAARLSHLVENVLSYARLERGRADGKIETLPLARLVDPTVSRLADRARQASMELVVEKDDSVRSAMVRANPSAVQQILFNLVDNACKYAADASDRRIHLTLDRTPSAVRLGIRDHGPGITRGTSRRLFKSFSKSAHEAANSAPGVGLGLALSRRLAKDMGGRLRSEKTGSTGALFILTLPASDEQSEP